MTSEQTKTRTKQFAFEWGHFTQQLAKTDINRNYSNQLIRSSGSVDANYKAVRRVKSKPDFINKLKIVKEELDESLLWLEMPVEFNKNKRTLSFPIYKEGEELLKIMVASINYSRKK